MSVRERLVLLSTLFLVCLTLLAAAVAGGWAAAGYHGALICALYGCFTVAAALMVGMIWWCVMPDRHHRKFRNIGHRFYCWAWWHVPYVPLFDEPAKSHPTDQVPRRLVPLRREHVRAIRTLCKPQFDTEFYRRLRSAHMLVETHGDR